MTGKYGKKKETGTMNLILLVMAVFLLMFVILLLWLYYRTGGIPDTLCTCVFAACGSECGIMGWIKTTKERQYGYWDRERQKNYRENRNRKGRRPSPAGKERKKPCRA